MVNKKNGVLVLAVLLFSLISISYLSAALTIKEDVVSAMAIKEINKPALYDITLTNNGEGDIFTMYSIALVDIQPNESFTLANGETRTIRVKALPMTRFKVSPDYYSFEYKIKGEKAGIQTDDLSMTIVALKDAFDISVNDVNPSSSTAVIHIKNKGGQAFDKITLEASSLLFNGAIDFSLNPFEDKKLEIALDKDKIRGLLTGQYVVNAKVIINSVEGALATTLNFDEKEGVKITESSEGTMIQRYQVEKKNEGNTNVDVSIIVTKDLVSSLFTSFNINPNKKEINGFQVNYVFSNQLAPNQALNVVATTNWWILVAIVVVVCVIVYLINKYLRNKLIMTKRATFVRTKGGEFALRVTIKVRARDFVERIRVLDRLPPMVKVFERYGLSNPEKIDPTNRRLEWNIQALSAGEERELSYIIYSKIGVVGKFELPAAESIYEYKGKIKEAESNRVIYDNESRSN